MPHRARFAVIWLAVGSLLGATVAAAVTSDDAARPVAEAAAITTPAATGSAVTVSAQAAERWAMSALEQQRIACATTHQAPDALERCSAD